jgi:hypothetical protein
MANSGKSKSFSDLVLSMTEVERIAMANDLLSALDGGASIPPKFHSADEVKRVAEALLGMANDIAAHHPGGTGW